MVVCLTKMGGFFFENGSLFFRKWEFVSSKMGVCFFRKWDFFFRKREFVFSKVGVCFFESGSLFFSKMGVNFFVCDLQCDLIISGRRLSRPMSVPPSGDTVVTVLFN